MSTAAASATSVGSANARPWSVTPTPDPMLREGVLAAVSCTTASFCVAVGGRRDGTTEGRWGGGVDATAAAVWNGSVWTSTATPVPPGATDSHLDSVACTSPTACMAVGTYDLGAFFGTLAETWNGSTWAIVPTVDPAPSPYGYDSLDGVSCPSATVCVAVGSYRTSNPSFALIERWDGVRWSVQPTPNTAGFTTLSGVSCASATDCTAVGQDGQGTLAEGWNGTAWVVQATPNPFPATGSASLSGVSCVAASGCSAVGSARDGSKGSQTLAEIYDSSGWHLQATPGIASTSSWLSGVSCTSVGACTAVGQRYGTYGFRSLTERWNGTRWVEQAPPSAEPGGAYLSGVSCVSPIRCTAVGSDNSPAEGQTLGEAWDGTSWTVQPTPNPPSVTQASLAAVSCVSPRSCAAVGLYGDGFVRNEVPLAEAWDGTSWTIETTALPPPGSNGSRLDAVSCVAATPVGACTAVGDASGSPLIETRQGTSWQIVPSPVAAAPGGLAGVSCTSPIRCTAVGFQVANGQQHALVEVWNGSAWSIQPTPDPPGATSVELRAISCASASSCVAVGLVTTTSGTATLAEVWDGTTWAIQPTPDPAGSSSGFAGVSCAGPAACTAVGTSDTSGTIGPLAEVLAGTTWTVQPLAVPAGATAASPTGVSCTSPTTCTAVGVYSESGGTRLLVEAYDGAAWTVQTTPRGPQLYPYYGVGVSCPPTGACTLVATDGYAGYGPPQTLVENGPRP